MTYAWHEHYKGPLTGTDWSKWLSRGDKSVDPYLIWADLSGAAGFAAKSDIEESGVKTGDHETLQKWPLIVEFKEAGMTNRSVVRECDNVSWIFGVMEIPAVYKSVRGGVTTIYTKYVTASVRPCDLEHVLSCKEIVRAQLGLPRISLGQTQPFIEKEGTASGPRPSVVVGIIDDGFGFAHSSFRGPDGTPRIKYLWDQDNRREHILQDKWAVPSDMGYGGELLPRQLALSIRADEVNFKDAWYPYRTLQYGRFRLDPLALSSAPLDDDGQEIPVESMLGASHGQSVADLAAGYPPLHRGQTAPIADSTDLSRARDVESTAQITESLLLTKKAGIDCDANLATKLDSADQWSLVFVQLPVRTVADTSGGSLAVHVLDGIRYILSRALQIPGAKDPENNPVVINLSYGALAGGHDGTSILEKAIDEVMSPTSQYKQNAWIVVAGGNAERDSMHASIEMLPGDSKDLIWRIGPDNPFESYLEIWLPHADVNDWEVPTEMAQRICLQISTPDGNVLTTARCGEVWQLRLDSDGEPVAAVIYARRVVQSERGSMILIAAAPTRSRGVPGQTSAHGEWAVSLHWNAPPAVGPALEIHAWTERSDILFGVPRGQQSRIFADEPTGETSEDHPEALKAEIAAARNPALLRGAHNVRPHFSLSSLAGGRPARERFSYQSEVEERGQVLVVGSQRSTDGEVSIDSSGGPSRISSRRQEALALVRPLAVDEHAQGPSRSRPDISAAGDISNSMLGVRTVGMHSEKLARISSTSAAAAQVTRAIANVQYIWTVFYGKNDNVRTKTTAVAHDLFFETNHSNAEESGNAGRSTLTPRHDDAFRRGRARPR